MLNFLLAFIPRAIVQGIPLLFGSTGEIVIEKSGNLNLGIPGVMYVGAICGVIGSFFYEHSVPDASATTLLQIDNSIEEASTILGADTGYSFRRITLPMLKNAFFSGIGLSLIHI